MSKPGQLATNVLRLGRVCRPGLRSQCLQRRHPYATLSKEPLSTSTYERPAHIEQHVKAEPDPSQAGQQNSDRVHQSSLSEGTATNVRGQKRPPASVFWNPESENVRVAFLGGRKLHTYPIFWLRDHCQCSKCTHQHTKQRQIDTYEIPADIAIRSLQPGHNGLAIEWSSHSHISYFSWDWLHIHSPFALPSPGPKRTYLRDTNASDLPRVKYDHVVNPKLHGFLLTYLTHIQTSGLCFVSGTPPNLRGTRKLLERISHIRPTHYGGLWDFTSVANPTDTAYTTLSLACHTDTTYFTDPCGLQMFHLLSHADGSGGESVFVDGFAAASHLFAVDREAYETLSRVRVVSHASGDKSAGVFVNTGARRGFPVLCHDLDSDNERRPDQLRQIRWNNDDRSPLTAFKDEAEMKAWYRAAGVWSGILKSEQLEITVQLQPGEPVIFDNWRVLHGRRAFTGKRRMCGAYVGMDDFLARLRGLQVETQESGKAGVEKQNGKESG